MGYICFSCKAIIKISQTKGLGDPTCGCTSEPFGIIESKRGEQKGVRNEVA